MHRLLAAALTCVVAALLAVGAALGAVALLNASPEQPNVPLVHFPHHEETRSPTPTSAPDED
ncbi:hypothetical protein [Streptomyces gobiensis]|uniref:hypothetical protein n=1 Tax=Streptomyces gobiensis TaxID=2875706 RepID=UPI001E41E33A|nr:hypothetical protein [Streptomyces gobiensis]UGY91206.1 hypothetical protein test1122_05385 [Streptomyces gobiensis]